MVSFWGSGKGGEDDCVCVGIGGGGFNTGLGEDMNVCEQEGSIVCTLKCVVICVSVFRGL